MAYFLLYSEQNISRYSEDLKGPGSKLQPKTKADQLDDKLEGDQSMKHRLSTSSLPKVYRK